MSEPPVTFSQIFLEVFESLPRQGPGNRDCAAKAIALCRGLPSNPAVLDLGCGTGGQTLHLAELTSGSIVAMDIHGPNIERLRTAVAARGLEGRIQPIVGDMADLGLPPESFDLVWSEGALYNIGVEKGLDVCRRLLRLGGYLAFTEAVWLRDDPPAAVKKMFEDYPAMGFASDVLAALERRGFSLGGHFTLPDEAWWGDFYSPMLVRIGELRGKYEGDEERLAVLDQLEQEPQMHRKYSEYYGYEFIVARRGK